MLVLKSFKVKNTADAVNSIGLDTYSTTVAAIHQDEMEPYNIETVDGDLFLSFVGDASITHTAGFTNAVSGAYAVTAGNHVIEVPAKQGGVFFGGSPVHRPHVA